MAGRCELLLRSLAQRCTRRAGGREADEHTHGGFTGMKNQIKLLCQSTQEQGGPGIIYHWSRVCHVKYAGGGRLGESTGTSPTWHSPSAAHGHGESQGKPCPPGAPILWAQRQAEGTQKPVYQGEGAWWTNKNRQE